MGITDFFKPVRVMTSEEVRKFISDKNPDEYNLIDVRQPREYEKGHIPGAHLMPLGELQSHVNKIDPQKPTIAY